jgi:hypothetical protein
MASAYQHFLYNTPLRKALAGVVGVVQRVLEEDPLSGSVFVGVTRRGYDVQVGSGERTGGGLLAQRLEHGRCHFPPAEAQQELSRPVFPLLVEGMALGGRH